MDLTVRKIHTARKSTGGKVPWHLKPPRQDDDGHRDDDNLQDRDDDDLHEPTTPASGVRRRTTQTARKSTGGAPRRHMQTARKPTGGPSRRQLGPSSAHESIPTLYDDTHRGATVHMSLGDKANLIGHLEHHAPSTDGSFAICIAGGTGAFVSKALYESIPKKHRPPLDRSHSQPVTFPTGGTYTATGSTIMPIIFTDRNTSETFQIKLRALVLERLLIGMFIAGGTGPFVATYFMTGYCVHLLKLGNGEEVEVEGC